MKKNLITALLITFSIGLVFAQKDKSSSKGNTDVLVTSVEERLKSWEQHSELSEESHFKSLPWRQVGPRFQGGRIESIVGIPGNPSIVYAAAGSGGVWKSVNAGTTWDPIFDNQLTQAIGDIEVWPEDPDLIWVGTGESLLSKSSYPGLGVFKSLDGGKTWANMGLHDSNHISRIAIDPTDKNIVYVAAMGHPHYPNEEKGLFKTVNGGDSWEKVLYINDKSGITDVIINPSNSNYLIASAWQNTSGLGSGIYVSNDAGKTWNKSTVGFPDHEQVGRIGVDISLTKPNIAYAILDNRSRLPQKEKAETQQELTVEMISKMKKKQFLAIDSTKLLKFMRYAGLQRSFSVSDILETVRSENHTPKSLAGCLNKYWLKKSENSGPVVGAEVYRSDDYGKTWSKTHGDRVYGYANHGWSFGDIRVAPDNHNEIYVLGTVLQRSVDGGKTFKVVDGKIVHLLENMGRNLHLDQHDLWIDPQNSDRLLVGNDGGIYITYDKGDSWLHPNTLPLAEFYRINVDMETPYNIYGGTQDNSSVFGPSDHDVSYGFEDPWDYVWLDLWAGGDGFYTMKDPSDPNIVYYEQQKGNLKKKDLRTGENKGIRPQREICEHELRFNWTTPFKFSEHDPATMYCTANKVFVSRNKGDDWEAISEDLTASKEDKPKGTITSFSESPIKPEILYTGTDKGLVFATTNGGKEWELISEGLPKLWVNRIVSSKFVEGRVYLCLTDRNKDDQSPYLYISEDFGKNWKLISEGLPKEPINVITEDPGNSDILYLGTDLGVYVSLDLGGAWISLNSQLPAIAVADLLIHPRDGELIIATHGRSAYVLDVNPIRQYKELTKNKEVKLFNINVAMLPRSRDYNGDWDMETTKTAVINFYSPVETSFEMIVTKSGINKNVQSFQGKTNKGLNTAIWDLVIERPGDEGTDYRKGIRMAEPGIYEISLFVDGKTEKGSFEVTEYR